MRHKGPWGGDPNRTGERGKGALSENLTKQPLLRNFLHPLNREELDVGHRHPLGLQQQIPPVLIAPAAVNQHTNVPVPRGGGYKNLRYLLLKAKRMAVT